MEAGSRGPVQHPPGMKCPLRRGLSPLDTRTLNCPANAGVGWGTPIATAQGSGDGRRANAGAQLPERSQARGLDRDPASRAGGPWERGPCGYGCTCAAEAPTGALALILVSESVNFIECPKFFLGSPVAPGRRCGACLRPPALRSWGRAAAAVGRREGGQTTGAAGAGPQAGPPGLACCTAERCLFIAEV